MSRQKLIKQNNNVSINSNEHVISIKNKLQSEAVALQQQWFGVLEAYGLPTNSKPEEVAYSVCGNERNFKNWFRHHGAKHLLVIDSTIEKVFSMLDSPNLNVFELSLIANALKSLSTSSFNMQKVMYDIIGIAKLSGKVEINVNSPAEKYTQNIIDMSEDEDLMNTVMVDESELSAYDDGEDE